MPLGKVGTWRNSRLFLSGGGSSESWDFEKFPGSPLRGYLLEGLGLEKIPGLDHGSFSYRGSVRIVGTSSP